MDQPQIRIAVTPEPTDEEAAAIAATVTLFLSAQAGSQVTESRTEERWKVAARRETLRSSMWPPEVRHGDW